MATFDDAGSRFQFGRTHWTRVLEAGRADNDAGAQARNDLLVRYHDAVFRYLLAKLGDAEAAGELFSRFAERVVELHPFLQRADPEKGRFRDYLRTVLSRMVIDYHRERQRDHRRRNPFEPEGLAQPEPDAADPFRSLWAEELMQHAWNALREAEEKDGRPYYTLLLYKAKHPETRSEAMARHFADEWGKPLTAPSVRQLLHRGQEKLSDLLVEEIARSLRKSPAESVSADAIADELADLGLLDKHRRDAVERYRDR